jgi:hypothetical protein
MIDLRAQRKNGVVDHADRPSRHPQQVSESGIAGYRMITYRRRHTHGQRALVRVNGRCMAGYYFCVSRFASGFRNRGGGAFAVASAASTGQRASQTGSSDFS